MGDRKINLLLNKKKDDIVYIVTTSDFGEDLLGFNQLWNFVAFPAERSISGIVPVLTDNKFVVDFKSQFPDEQIFFSKIKVQDLMILMLIHNMVVDVNPFNGCQNIIHQQEMMLYLEKNKCDQEFNNVNNPYYLQCIIKRIKKGQAELKGPMISALMKQNEFYLLTTAEKETTPKNTPIFIGSINNIPAIILFSSFSIANMFCNQHSDGKHNFYPLKVSTNTILCINTEETGTPMFFLGCGEDGIFISMEEFKYNRQR